MPSRFWNDLERCRGCFWDDEDIVGRTEVERMEWPGMNGADG
jgi:hypothetical protein